MNHMWTLRYSDIDRNTSKKLNIAIAFKSTDGSFEDKAYEIKGI